MYDIIEVIGVVAIVVFTFFWFIAFIDTIFVPYAKYIKLKIALDKKTIYRKDIRLLIAVIKSYTCKFLVRKPDKILCLLENFAPHSKNPDDNIITIGEFPNIIFYLVKHKVECEKVQNILIEKSINNNLAMCLITFAELCKGNNVDFSIKKIFTALVKTKDDYYIRYFLEYFGDNEEIKKLKLLM